MDPPSVLYGAMNKERKPFTYTPGGLDLSEIKSERMAQRLMRNAMSQGVPETPVQTIQQTQPTQLNTGAIPNFNCLPVQVFPTFPLPANPKSLLRTRSNPDPSKELSTNIISTPSTDETWTNINKPSLLISNNNNNFNNRPPMINEDKHVSCNSSKNQPTNYGSDGQTEIILPEKSYDAEYFVLEPQGNITLMGNKTNTVEDNILSYNRPIKDANVFMGTATDVERNPIVLTSSSSQDRANDFEQKEVKIVKKQTKTENEPDQNGDTEAAIVVKLPSKKSSAKTETNVEVLKKILPDGSIEEIKTTITKTTIDGKTEIKTETETRILPKEQTEDIVEAEEQEEEESEEVVIEENDSEQNEKDVIEESTVVLQSNAKQLSESEEENEEILKKAEIKENGHIITGEEKVEISTTKNVIVSQTTEQESEEEQEDVIEEENEEGDVDIEQVIILKKHEVGKTENSDDENVETKDSVKEDETEDVEDEEVVEEENVEDEQENVKEDIKKDIEEVEEEEEVEVDEDEQNEDIDETEKQSKIEEQLQAKEITHTEIEKQEEGIEEEYDEAEDVEVKTNLLEQSADDSADVTKESTVEKEAEKVEPTIESTEKISTSLDSFPESSVPKEDINTQQIKDENERIHKITVQSEPKVSFPSLIEPSIPLEKVEDVEIKPIGPAQEIIKKCHTEIITTTKDEPTGALSTQTEYNRIENIVTVNRTTKTLDPPYEQVDHTIPTVKTYFVPHNDRILSTPQPISRPYQPVYTPEPQSERRHSLLLDRLSVDRQIPVQQPDIYQNNYQYNNQSYEQNQWLQEPQSEVLTVSNVKPSTISKNQQWYQQSKREENITSNIVTPTPVMPSQLSQPLPQSQQQPQYQSYVQPQHTPKAEFQPTYTDSNNQNSFKQTTNIQQNIYPSYTPKPSWVSSTFDPKPAPTTQSNQYSTLQKESKESYQKSTQQFSSSYVPPPWEQDSSYVVDQPNQNYYQPSPATPLYTPNITNTTWKPKPPPSKFSKPTPTAYIPPAPNQSFVKPVTNADQNILPGRKTYYSEYERRYISVPESTYIPSETKFQAQPDPSPQYYYDNNEPSETVEPQWRKELREFTERTSQSTTSQTEQISVRPPWEDDPKYAAPQYTPTPTWTQTLRPRSWRERSYEPEYIGSKEWPKTSTLGRGRPQSSYVKSNVDRVQERTRGVSVDRYNPNSYQSPTEQPPVQSHTLTPNTHPKTYHNPNVPAYHARTSAEPREHTAHYQQQRSYRESRAPPIQSRSFKYLQWITGTED